MSEQVDAGATIPPEPEYPPFPQHAKASEAEDRRSAAQEFLDYLYDEKGLMLCRWQDEFYQHDDGRKGALHPETNRVVFPASPDVPMDFADSDTYERAAHFDDYDYIPAGHYPAVTGDSAKGRLLAEYIGVNYDAYQEEVEAAYRYVVNHRAWAETVASIREEALRHEPSMLEMIDPQPFDPDLERGKQEAGAPSLEDGKR
jgi:hypothetical protein